METDCGDWEDDVSGEAAWREEKHANTIAAACGGVRKAAMAS